MLNVLGYIPCYAKLFRLTTNTAFLSNSAQIETQDGTILLDYSKNIITEETMKHLMDLVCLTLYMKLPFCSHR